MPPPKISTHLFAGHSENLRYLGYASSFFGESLHFLDPFANALAPLSLPARIVARPGASQLCDATCVKEIPAHWAAPEASRVALPQVIEESAWMEIEDLNPAVIFNPNVIEGRYRAKVNWPGSRVPTFISKLSEYAGNGPRNTEQPVRIETPWCQGIAHELVPWQFLQNFGVGLDAFNELFDVVTRRLGAVMARDICESKPGLELRVTLIWPICRFRCYGTIDRNT
jgi:hypothetical protein